MPAPSASPAAPSAAVPSRAYTAAVVALLALIYLWVFPYHAGVNNPNENVRVYMTVAIVDDHTFAINRIEHDWGYVNDKSVREGRLYSSKAPGTSYLGVPAYWLLTKVTGRDSHPLTPAQIAAHHKPPLDRTLVVYVLRLFTNVLPALLFAWFWHRFLGRYTSHPVLRDAVFFSTMLGSPMFAYSEMFASHAHNAFACMAALMALATARARDRASERAGAPRRTSAGLFALAGLFGAAATAFEYPAAIASAAVALLILGSCVERRPAWVFGSVALVAVGAKLFAGGHKAPAAVALLLAAAAYGATLDLRSVARLCAAGAGSLLPVGLTLLYHKRCFGSPFKPGYSFLENPEFHTQISQGFFGAGSFSWEAALRLWADPSFGLLVGTLVLLAAIPGFGSFFSVPLPRRQALGARVAFGALALVCAVKATSTLLALKAAGNWAAPAAAGCSWLALLVLALIALSAVSLPAPLEPDAGVGAALMLACLGLTRLIGAMNNWRGGWQVGPRYLATLVPLLALAALVGLDAIARGSPARRRAATVFASGATAAALLLSGLPSAFFPHIPTEISSPLYELFLPLLRGHFAPHNAGRYLFHWEGLRGLIPVFIAALVALALVLRGEDRRPLAVAAHATAGVALALFLLAPFALASTPESAGVLQYVQGVWEPRPPTGAAGATVAAPRADRAAPTPESLRERGRALARSGNGAGAFEAFRRAAELSR